MIWTLSLEGVPLIHTLTVPIESHTQDCSQEEVLLNPSALRCQLIILYLTNGRILSQLSIAVIIKAEYILHEGYIIMMAIMHFLADKLSDILGQKVACLFIIMHIAIGQAQPRMVIYSYCCLKIMLCALAPEGVCDNSCTVR